VLTFERFRGDHYIIDALSIMGLLYVLYDFGYLLIAGASTDAIILARMTDISAEAWAILWSVVALFVLVAAGKQTLTRPELA
jgi:hypothetical protein